MKITAIKQQVKQKGKYSIFVDERYSFSLSELGLINSGLRLGQKLSEEEIEAHKQASAQDKLYNRVLGLLARRMRSSWEITDYMRRHKAEEDVSTSILNKLSNLKYIDDEAFARSWVENRKLLKPTSLRKLRAELRQKHINDDIISRVLSLEKDADKDSLGELVARKRRQAKYQDDLKLMQYLARQGFNYQDIKSAMNSEDYGGEKPESADLFRDAAR